ncbi:hypothetical protein [Pseudomonas simiae]|uniref:hypothetical protein n=1 Tax=Pseudomonas simiae TaxID=321846 RepID=UPI0016540526|nr:hypothetical protein [Pseudomonas simiae]MBC3965348.1 hypothetical protein [Pseudomonas simiae]UNK68475.1 hypothetical protein MNO08_10420 [Pseudomonas simiae]WLG36108.1 hypothetical protein PSH82_10160 [Pseudomonas simiae]WLI26043.1 hypothetical protein PSH85_10185 [Pseudomonas simiae]
MTAQIQKTKTATSQIRCQLKAEGCKGRFRQTRKSDKYCSVCSPQAAKVKARKTTATTIPRSSAFVQTLVDEAIRAGHLEIFQNIRTAKALTALHAVVSVRMKANFAAGNNSYHVCHIAPVQHPTRLGTFEAENLFVGSAEKNKAAGSYAPNAGVYLALTKLKACNEVNASMGRAAVLDMIIEYIGEATFKAFVKQVKLKDSMRVQIVAKIESLVDPLNPEHKQYITLAASKTSTTQALQAALAELTGKTPFKPSFSRVNESAMLVAEIRRHSEFREELQILLPAIDSATHHMEKTRLVVKLTVEHDQTMFDLLQGYDVAQADIDDLEYALRANERAVVEAIEVIEFNAPVFMSDEAFDEWLMGEAANAPVFAQERVEYVHTDQCIPF